VFRYCRILEVSGHEFSAGEWGEWPYHRKAPVLQILHCVEVGRIHDYFLFTSIDRVLRGPRAGTTGIHAEEPDLE
jgi:hypothetical protein